MKWNSNPMKSIDYYTDKLTMIQPRQERLNMVIILILWVYFYSLIIKKKNSLLVNFAKEKV